MKYEQYADNRIGLGIGNKSNWIRTDFYIPVSSLYEYFIANVVFFKI